MFPIETAEAESALFGNSQKDENMFWPNKEKEDSFGFVEPVRETEVESNPNMITPDLIREVAGNTDPFFRTEMLQTIDQVEEYSWSRGEMGGLDWGFESLNKAFEGLNTGVHLIGGQSNIGKVK